MAQFNSHCPKELFTTELHCPSLSWQMMHSTSSPGETLLLTGPEMSKPGKFSLRLDVAIPTVDAGCIKVTRNDRSTPGPPVRAGGHPQSSPSMAILIMFSLFLHPDFPPNTAREGLKKTKDDTRYTNP